MSRRGSGAPRRPATKLPKLRKKLQKGKLPTRQGKKR